MATLFHTTRLELPKIQLFSKNFNMNFDGRDVGQESIMRLVMKGKACVSKIDLKVVRQTNAV
jgi:hypothetical protein